MAYYWDYWNSTSTTTTSTGSYHYYNNWTGTATTGTTYWVPVQAPPQDYLITGFDDWSEAARATLTRLINDETNTGFKIRMWISGDVAITDPDIQIRDLDWFLLKLRQVATASDYQKIMDCVATARDEAAQGIAAGTDETAQQAQPVGQEPDPKGCAQTPSPSSSPGE